VGRLGFANGKKPCLKNICRYIDQEKDGMKVAQYGNGKFNTRLKLPKWGQSMKI
jgi:hypothetical protein